ncbi:MAG: hypothetical protein HY297_02515 [Thaumarchaeota archaeon]|nr:hypothetical protein [Nitrososphaerota archaeon]
MGLTADERSYAAFLIEDNLGLPKGEVDGKELPGDLAELIGSTLRGKREPAGEGPDVEEAIRAYGEQLRKDSLRTEGYFVRKARWPGGAPFAACITHDVDNVSRPLKHVLERRRRFSTAGVVLAALGVRSLYDNISEVAKIERKRGVTSTYYLLSSEYDLAKLARKLGSLRARGWEVGLHGDFGTHDSPERMAEAVGRFTSALGFAPRGLREHYLQFDFGKTWEVAQGAGFLHDSSVGNRDKLGFKVGLCTPFQPPGSDWEPMSILELPLVLMDTTLWGYLKLDEQQGLEAARRILDRVEDLGGLFTLLWHQESVKMKGGRMFAEIIDMVLEKGCYAAPAAAIASWWTARKAPLVHYGGVYRLDGTPPEGLCLEFEGKEGLKPLVKGGTMEEMRGKTLVRVASDDFELRVG